MSNNDKTFKRCLKELKFVISTVDAFKLDDQRRGDLCSNENFKRNVAMFAQAYTIINQVLIKIIQVAKQFV